MNCQSATSVVEKKRDGKLSFAERLGLWIHLSYCSLCKIFFKQSEIIDRSYSYYAGEVSLEQKKYTLDPLRRDAIDKAFKEELKK